MVEQGTHKPLVGSSNLPPGIRFILRFGIADSKLPLAFVELDVDCRSIELLAQACGNERREFSPKTFRALEILIG